MRHKDKEIRAAFDDAVARGWHLKKGGAESHVWGVLYCPGAERGACNVFVYETPRVPANEAEKIRRAIRTCPH